MLTAAGRLALVLFVFLGPRIAHTEPVGLPAQRNGSEVMPLQTRDFIQLIGVNQHVGYTGTVYANASLELRELDYLGIKHVRDQAPTLSNLARYRVLASAGVKFDLITSPARQDVASTLPNDISCIKSLSISNRGSVLSIEGPNELNGDQIVYWHGSSSKDPEAAIGIMRAVSSIVRGDPALSDIGIVNLSLHNGKPGWRDYLARLGDLSRYVDFANWHVYFDGGAQPLSHVTSMLDDALQSAPGKPIVFTEAGYTTAFQTPPGVDEATQARNTLNLLADAFTAGVRKVYLYELMEGLPNPPATDFENRFGLFHADGTAKPAATAIHNLVHILGSNASGEISTAARAPEYSFGDFPDASRSILLQKSEDVYDLIVWNEPKNWDSHSRTRIPIQPTSASIKFGRVHRTVRIFDPVSSVNHVKVVDNTDSIAFQLTDHLLVIEVVQ